MANANPSKFIVDSDFPMPAQVSQTTGTVNIPAGSGAGGASYADTYTTDVDVGSDAQICRLSIESSRDGVIVPGDKLIQYYSDGTFIAFFQNIGNGKVRCTVQITSGYSSSATISSANNFTFYISSFKLP